VFQLKKFFVTIRLSVLVEMISDFEKSKPN